MKRLRRRMGWGSVLLCDMIVYHACFGQGFVCGGLLDCGIDGDDKNDMQGQVYAVDGIEIVARSQVTALVLNIENFCP